MVSVLARGCPPGPFPGWCDPVIPGPARSCQPQPPSGQLRSGVCYVFGPHAVSWWTLPHLAALAGLALALPCAAGLALAVARDALAARRPGRGRQVRQ